jgi:hypothetical protein
MKTIHWFYFVSALCVTFFAGLVLGMIAMRDFMAEEFIVIDPEKLQHYRQIHEPVKKSQGMTA